MKTILVPTDFSDNARNAVNYAVEIAKLTKAKLILFHAFHIPITNSDIPVGVIPIEAIEKENINRLKNIMKEIQSKNNEALNIECICKMGFAVDEITEMVKTKNIDLVVMSIRGANYLSEILMGSITTALIRNGCCPVVVINQNVKFKNIKKIVFASDYHEISDESIMKPLKEFVELFKSHVYVFNVVREMKAISFTGKAGAGNLLEHSLEGTDHTFHFAEQEDVIESINTFAANKKADMIVMIPHKHSFLENIFYESNTKRMAFHTHIPLLALQAC